MTVSIFGQYLRFVQLMEGIVLKEKEYFSHNEENLPSGKSYLLL